MRRLWHHHVQDRAGVLNRRCQSVHPERFAQEIILPGCPRQGRGETTSTFRAVARHAMSISTALNWFAPTYIYLTCHFRQCWSSSQRPCDPPPPVPAHYHQIWLTQHLGRSERMHKHIGGMTYCAVHLWLFTKARMGPGKSSGGSSAIARRS